MQPSPHRILLIGYGNPAREDDGIGPSVAEEIERMGIEGVDVDSDYQLTVEDAAAVSEHDAVVFVDASVDGGEPFAFRRLSPVRSDSFSTHSVSPEAVLGLARDLFGAVTEGYLLGIRGYSFAMFRETMTQQARENTKKAVEFLAPVLRMKGNGFPITDSGMTGNVNGTRIFADETDFYG